MDSEKTEAEQATTAEQPFEEAVRETVTGSAAPQKGRGRGRPVGSMNKIQATARQAILEADPISFLVRVMEGRKFRRAGTDSARRTVDCFPSLEQSICAAETLARKVAADLKSKELTGDPDRPVHLARAKDIASSGPRELARRLEVTLAAAGLDGIVAQALGADDDADKPPLEAPKKPNGNAGTSEAEAPASGRPTPSNDTDDALSPPGKGQSLWFGSIECRHRKPSLRPTDPPTYEVYRNDGLLRQGSWQSCLQLCHKFLGPDLPKGEVRSTQARSSHSLPRPLPQVTSS